MSLSGTGGGGRDDSPAARRPGDPPALDLSLVSRSGEDTLAIGKALGEVLRPGDVVALTGELGAGKTVFCKGVGEALGIPARRIASPSFTLVAEHHGRFPLFHVDVYRLGSEREAEDAGIGEVLEGEGICVVEWAEKIPSLLPTGAIRVTFHGLEGEERRLRILGADAPRFLPFRIAVRPFARGG